jgi:hypothetical protein
MDASENAPMRAFAAATDSVARFTPVTPKPRHDGWTVDKQRSFIEHLVSTGSVTQACRAVGMSRQAAYALRFSRGAEGFAGAWDAALTLAGKMLADVAFELAMVGEEVPHYHKGELVGTHIRHDKGLVKWMIARLDRKKFGRIADIPGYYDPNQHEEAAQNLLTNMAMLKRPK